MGYVLEKISDADLKKIYSDAACNPSKQRLLKIRRFLDEPTGLTWAVDRERDIYLLHGPNPRPEPTFGGYYIFHFSKNMLWLRVKGITDQTIYVEDGQSFAKYLTRDLQEEIKAAFSVYGRTGEGPAGDFRFSPIFEKKA